MGNRFPPRLQTAATVAKVLEFFLFKTQLQPGVAKRKKQKANEKRGRQEIASEDDDGKRAALSKSGRGPNVCLNCLCDAPVIARLPQLLPV